MVRDWVVAADPETGERGPRQVTRLWIHQDTLVDLIIGGSALTTTEDHPIWNATDNEWQQAQSLDPGDLVLTSDGKYLTVQGSDWGRPGRLGVDRTVCERRGVPVMRLALRSIEWASQDACRVVFVEDGCDLVEAVFTLDRSPIGVLAPAEPDVFLDCGGTAEEVRMIVAAVTRFCRAAQGEVTEG